MVGTRFFFASNVKIFSSKCAVRTTILLVHHSRNYKFDIQSISHNNQWFFKPRYMRSGTGSLTVETVFNI